MKVFILGGTGFIGKHVIPALLQENHEVYALIRPHSKASLPGNVIQVSGDGMCPGAWQKIVPEVDAIINLAGMHIARLWTKSAKDMIYHSRIDTTHHVVEAMRTSQLLLNASAIGYYGCHPSEIFHEDSPPGKDFLANLCQTWEKEALAATAKSAKVIVARFGIVLGHGGILEQMGRMYQRFLGCQLGSGKQWFSWIHIHDLLNAILWFLDPKAPNGIYNFCSPYPIRSEELTKLLAQALRVSTVLSVPAYVIRALLGECAAVILEGQRVIPQKLLAQKFPFRFPTIDEAIEDLLREEGRTNQGN